MQDPLVVRTEARGVFEDLGPWGRGAGALMPPSCCPGQLLMSRISETATGHQIGYLSKSNNLV